MVHRILSLPLLTAEIRDFRPFNASSLSTALGTDVAPSLLLPERCRLASGATRTPSATWNAVPGASTRRRRCCLQGCGDTIAPRRVCDSCRAGGRCASSAHV